MREVDKGGRGGRQMREAGWRQMREADEGGR